MEQRRKLESSDSVKVKMLIRMPKSISFFQWNVIWRCDILLKEHQIFDKKNYFYYNQIQSIFWKLEIIGYWV